MKSKLIVTVLLIVFQMGISYAQETPPSPPSPPTKPEPPMPPSGIEPGDTTRISLGDKQIMIIDNKKKNEKSEEREAMEAEKEMKAEKLLLEAEKKQLENEMEDDSNKEKGRKNENVAPRDRKMKKADKKRYADIDFLDIDLGFNFLTFKNSLAEPIKKDLKIKAWGSWSTTFTFLPTKIFLGSPNFFLLTGLGWRIGQFEFKEKVDFVPNQTLEYTLDANIEESQFVIHQLQIPLGLYIQSHKIKGLGRIGIGVGGYAGVLIHQELETETKNPKRSIETEEDFGFEEFRYGLNARVDIGAIKLFANMDMNKLWKNNDIKNIECGLWFDF